MIPETLSALETLGAAHQRAVLKRAADQWEGEARPRIGTAEAYVDTALQGEFDELDAAYHACSPTVEGLLAEYLRKHQDSFVEIV